MTKIILATLFALSFSVFANEHEKPATDTPPAAEGTMPPADGAAATDAKADAKGKHDKGAMAKKKGAAKKAH